MRKRHDVARMYSASLPHTDCAWSVPAAQVVCSCSPATGVPTEAAGAD